MTKDLDKDVETHFKAVMESYVTAHNLYVALTGEIHPKDANQQLALRYDNLIGTYIAHGKHILDDFPKLRLSKNKNIKNFIDVIAGD